MKINLQKNSFSTFKIISGSVFLLVSILFYKVSSYALIAALLVGRTHSLGAWLSMWRAKKLTIKYILWMILLSVIVSYWGVTLVSLLTLAFITHLLFTFHFIFDEFELQEERRNLNNLISSICPTVVIVLFLVRDFFNLTSLNVSFFISIVFVLLALELIYIKEINWFFIQTKILTLFALAGMILGTPARVLLGVLLIFHYFFWFIYPVYKLHKYNKKEERDGLVMILLLMTSTGLYFSMAGENFGERFQELATKAFYIGTIIHILSTAPFGTFFGLAHSQNDSNKVIS